MRKTIWFWLTLLFAAAALAATAVLLVDYVRPAPVFCDATGGCAKVKATIFARPLGIPLPALGLVGLFGLALTSLVPGRKARVAQLVLGIGGAAVALLLFGVQAKIGVLCPFCAVVDASAIALALLGVVRWRTEGDPPGGWIAPTLSAVALLVAIGVPLAIGFGARIIPGEVPAAVAEEMRRTGRGKVTVVDFIDFECPFCRMTHAELAPLVEQRKAKLRVVRKHVPLRMHPHAMDAAKAACCGEALGKSDEIAEALVSAPPESLTREGCEKIAVAHGLDAARFAACLDDPATAARIEKDREAFRESKAHGLPTLWVDGTKLEGAQDRASLADALDHAIGAL